MKSLNVEKIKQVEDFKYLGSFITSTEHDVNIRLGKAWDALNEHCLDLNNTSGKENRRSIH